MRASILAFVVAAFFGAGVSEARAQTRTAWGDPDIQGVWSNATLTPLERPTAMAGKEVLTDEEAAAVERTGLQPLLTTLAREVQVSGELNDLWLEPGTHVVRTRRTSLVVDPPDGQVPYTPEGRKRRDAAAAAAIVQRPAASWLDRNLAERCIQTEGILMPNPFYLNNHHIFQTQDYVAILSEVMHHVRIIPLDGRPRIGGAITQWFGDSRGRWEGETLVVETANFNDRRAVRGASPALRLVERFTRVDNDTIDYEATIDDPATFSRPWTLANTLRRTLGPLYEYACHEGNYGMINILSGARAQERQAAASGASPEPSTAPAAAATAAPAPPAEAR